MGATRAASPELQSAKVAKPRSRAGDACKRDE